MENSPFLKNFTYYKQKVTKKEAETRDLLSQLGTATERLSQENNDKTDLRDQDDHKLSTHIRLAIVEMDSLAREIAQLPELTFIQRSTV